MIVGGGLGGLACGALLSKLGLGVIVLERQPHVGGCLQSYRRNGIDVDTGFHYVGGLDEGQSLHGAFAALGLLDLPWHRLDPDGFDRVAIGSMSLAFAQGFDNFLNRLASDFPAERSALRDYVQMLRLSANTQLEALNPKATTSDFTLQTAATSAWNYLDEKFNDKLLIDIISGTSLKTELCKRSLPLSSFLHSNASFIESSWRLRGGGSAIAESLAKTIADNGGEVVCKREVVALQTNGRCIDNALCSNGETYEGTTFISDIHPVTTCHLVEPQTALRLSYRHRMEQMDNTFGMFTVSLQIERGALPYFNHNLYAYVHPGVWGIHEDNKPVGGVMISCRVPTDGDSWATQIDLLTPMTWRQVEQWSNTRVGKRGADYETMKQHVADECVALASRHIPALASAKRIATSSPLTWRDYTATPFGSAYGLRKDCAAPLLSTLSARTPIGNLLLTGQNLVMHGVHGVTMTALLTCAEVVGRESIWNIVKE